MKTLGVIGGLGPMATAHFMRLVTEMTLAASDQEHLEMLIYSKTSTPDRTAYLLGRSKESPLPSVLDAGHVLEQQGAQVIAIPCITLHCFFDKIAEELNVPLINTVRDTVMYVRERGVESLGIMATEGTVRGRLFHNELEAMGMTAVTPSDKYQKYITEIIYGSVKQNKPVDTEKFFEVSEHFRSMGADCVVLGCTELSLIKPLVQMPAGFIDVLEVLAMRSITLCDARLSPEYDSLITGGGQ